MPATPPGLEPPQHKEGQKRERSRSGSRRQRGDTTSSISQPTHIYQNGVPKGPAPNTPSQKAKSAHSPINTGAPLPPPIPMADPPELEVTSPMTPGGNPQEKKIRGLLKKIRAIEDLKMRHASGEKLEGSQIQLARQRSSARCASAIARLSRRVSAHHRIRFCVAEPRWSSLAPSACSTLIRQR